MSDRFVVAPSATTTWVVRQLLHGVIRDRRANDPPLDVDLVHRGLDEPHAIEARPDGLRAVTQLDHAGAGLEEQGREQEEVVAVHESDLDVLAVSQFPVEVPRRGESAHATTGDDDARPYLCVAVTWRMPEDVRGERHLDHGLQDEDDRDDGQPVSDIRLKHRDHSPGRSAEPGIEERRRQHDDRGERECDVAREGRRAGEAGAREPPISVRDAGE